MYIIMSSANKYSFIPSFLIFVSLISFSCFIALAGDSTAELNRSDEPGHPSRDPN